MGCACDTAGLRPSPIVRPTEIVPLVATHPVARPSYISSLTPKDPFIQLGSPYRFPTSLPESPVYVSPSTEGIRSIGSGVYETEAPFYQQSTFPLEQFPQSGMQQAFIEPQSLLPPAYVPSEAEPQNRGIIPTTTSGSSSDFSSTFATTSPTPFRDAGMVYKVPAPLPRGEPAQTMIALSASQVYTKAPSPLAAAKNSRPLDRFTQGITRPYAGTETGQIQVKSSDLVTEAASIYNAAEEMAQEKPLFLTYYNQECAGVMVHVTRGKSIMAATDECLEIACEAINAEMLSGNEYMKNVALRIIYSNLENQQLGQWYWVRTANITFHLAPFTYLITARGRTNKKGSYCISLRAVPVRTIQSFQASGKETRELVGIEKLEYLL
ncbi:hypothetical protein GCK32_000564 [Trichostrongylus colubriformis]|uniref:Uncharacterized protein n=1 Tax=Trichostrongylus colubriformis TaxID=6319 RepID=A0AAN8FNS0_TRICO